MELKQTFYTHFREFIRLLIVPYGIETKEKSRKEAILSLLLIVPYGIETAGNRRDRKSYQLLIVPYGIETIIFSCRTNLMHSFNCTLWN